MDPFTDQHIGNHASGGVKITSNPPGIPSAARRTSIPVYSLEFVHEQQLRDQIENKQV
jgi:hypothetical protein